MADIREARAALVSLAARIGVVAYSDVVERGGMARLAEALEVTPKTVSRWWHGSDPMPGARIVEAGRSPDELDEKATELDSMATQSGVADLNRFAARYRHRAAHIRALLGEGPPPTADVSPGTWAVFIDKGPPFKSGCATREEAERYASIARRMGAEPTVVEG